MSTKKLAFQFHIILKYVDDPELRSVVHKQLNKGESGNKLDRALAVGRTDYIQRTKEDQELVESCKRVIKNAIVCWNSMYLSQQLLKTTSAAEKRRLIKKIQSSSTLSWEHILFHGVYDFSDGNLRDSMNFKFSGMQNPKIIEV